MPNHANKIVNVHLIVPHLLKNVISSHLQGQTAVAAPSRTCGLPELKSFTSCALLYKRYAYGNSSLGQPSFLELEEESEKQEGEGTGKRGDWRAAASRNRWYDRLETCCVCMTGAGDVVLTAYMLACNLVVISWQPL